MRNQPPINHVRIAAGVTYQRIGDQTGYLGRVRTYRGRALIFSSFVGGRLTTRQEALQWARTYAVELSPTMEGA